MSNKAPSFFLTIKLQVLFLAVLGGVNIWLWLWLQKSQEEGAYPIYLVAIHWILLLIFLLWLGNLIIYRWVRRKYSWDGSFNRRFFLQLILTLVYSLTCINATYILFKNTFTALPPDQNQLILLNIYGLLFLLPILSLQFGFLFLYKWRKAIVEQENLKKEQTHSELIALKSHISPHFLFNNLNILSSLIDTGNYAAQDYLDRFAEVYRYVLKNRERELVPLREELQFIHSYIFLLNQRFPSGLEIDIQVAEALKEHQLPPLSLQMVVENALKHNKLSETSPLSIRISSTDNSMLMISNNLQTRNIPEGEKTGFGLENIRRRYWLVAKKTIEVTNTSELFTVVLPLLLNQQRYESTNH